MKIIDMKLDLRKKKQFCIVSLFQVLKVNKENDTESCEKTLMRFTL